MISEAETSDGGRTHVSSCADEAMKMESHYEINVSLNGRHLFATAPRSGVLERDAQRAFDEISKRFPQAEGFQISVTHWDCKGFIVPWVPWNPLLPPSADAESRQVLQRVVDNAVDSSRRAAKRKR